MTTYRNMGLTSPLMIDMMDWRMMRKRVPATSAVKYDLAMSPRVSRKIFCCWRFSTVYCAALFR